MRISIMGDSISTYEGWNPPGYAVYYDGLYAHRSGLSGVEDTWWWRVICGRGHKLVQNNSFSGSRVSGNVFPSACCPERATAVAGTDEPPEAVLFYIGVNDFGYCTPLDLFAEDYALMLDRVAASCPEARLICATPLKASMRGHRNWTFPLNQIGLDLDDYNDVIREVVAVKKAELADLAAQKVTYEALDGVHPTAEGMKTIARAWMGYLADLDARGA